MNLLFENLRVAAVICSI